MRSAPPSWDTLETRAGTSTTVPNYTDADMVLLKNVRLSGRFRMQIRSEFFNLFNHPQFRQPGNVIENPGTFGLSTQTLTRPDGTTSARQIQLALKLNF